LADLWAGTKEYLRKRGVNKPMDASRSVLLPLIVAAVDEDRPVLKELWEKLLAAAMDPARTNEVRPSLIELLKHLDPVDALVLKQLTSAPHSASQGDLADSLALHLKVSRDEAWFSLEHLHELGGLEQAPNSMPIPRVSAKARLLMRAVSD
jgi:hypothetical protein